MLTLLKLTLIKLTFKQYQHKFQPCKVKKWESCQRSEGKISAGGLENFSMKKST